MNDKRPSQFRGGRDFLYVSMLPLRSFFARNLTCAVFNISLRLRCEELAISAALVHQLAVRALLDHLAVLENDDKACNGRARKSVRHEYGSLVRAQAVKLIEYLLLGHRVK